MWKIFSIIFVQMIIINKITAQYQVSGLLPMKSQPRSVINQKQNNLGPLLMSLMNKAPVTEKIETVASALQRYPARVAGRKNKRHEMADILKQSALQSLMVAANACKTCNKDLPMERMPLRNPMAGVPNVPRPVKMQYM